MKIFATLLLSLTTLILSGQTKAYTLEECVLLALDKNISIKQSEIEIESAAIDRADAIGGFLPRISAQSQLHLLYLQKSFYLSQQLLQS